MKMMIRQLIGCAVSLVCGIASADLCEDVVSEVGKVAHSPDGKNEIRLYENPLSYEVLRRGRTVVERSRIDLVGSGPCEVEIIARNDGVAYRFVSKTADKFVVSNEIAEVRFADGADYVLHKTTEIGCEENVANFYGGFNDILMATNEVVYLPMLTEGTNFVCVVTDAGVRDYPIWNLKKTTDGFRSAFARFPSKTLSVNWKPDMDCDGRRLRKFAVLSEEPYLVETQGPRAFPWRVFALADKPSDLIGSAIVDDLAGDRASGDFSWVRPGKVAWDWWNAFDNKGDPCGCTTATYERFIDFASKHDIEYVILDEGWSEKLNIWKFHPNVDVPHLIEYAAKRNVGIILWMAWAQIKDDEERVAAHFAKLGAKGFKVDFMDSGDAMQERFLWKFAAACAENRMIVDYHGAHRPTGLSKVYPNVLNWEGVHGLERMKAYQGKDILANDVAIAFTRMLAGPMDYTPGAMDNFAVGTYPVVEKEVDVLAMPTWKNPGSLGTRARQMAMMIVYPAPLQMLCDAPSKYEKNSECFSFMAKTPVVWTDVVGLWGSPNTMAALARKSRDGVWYAAGITNAKARHFALDTHFLGDGVWTAEIFRDAADSDREPTHYVHERKVVKAGEKIAVDMMPGGGFVIRFEIGDLAEYVNPFVGTDGPGHTHPAACVPFGMVQAGPDTGTGAWDYCSGYQYRDNAVLGYSQTHLNGTGCPDLGDIQVLPFSGEVGTLPMMRAIDKESEKASPGWYEVHQPDDGVKVEIAAAKRAAIYRFTWEKGREAKVLVNLPFGIEEPWTGFRITGSDVQLADDCIVRGEINKDAWIKDRKVAFELEFDCKWAKVEELPREKGKDAPRYVMSFDLGASQTVMMKIALSFTSAANAKANLAAEIPDWDIEGVRDAARNEWNALFARSFCEGSDDQKRNWYTALYHLYLQPNDYSDIGKKPYYTTLSLWDTFRASHPWYSIVTPEIVRPVIDSTMELWRRDGRLPVMSYGGKNIDCMIGNHAVPVIVDAFLKEQVKVEGEGEQRKNNSTVGLRASTSAKYWESVYAAIKNTLTQAHDGKPKEDWGLYDKYGYFPCDIIRGESVSRTFECCYDDWCAAQMAKGLGKMDDYDFFMKRAQNWKNVFDSSIGFGRGKTTAGKWREPFDPFVVGHGADTDNDFTEGNAFQYSWHVMQDVPGLVAAMGGREKFVAQLDSLFAASDKVKGVGMVVDVTGLIGQYVHGNEPSHHVIYFYPQVGYPEKAAERIREVFDKFYLPKIDGLCGNDDCGQMSAWYLFSAMGFYPFNPCGGEYIIGAPQVPAAQVKVGGEGERRMFSVLAKGLSKENKYVKSVTLNGKPITDWKICHEDIMKGGELVFEMGGKK